MKAPNGAPGRNNTGDGDSAESGLKNFNFQTELIRARLEFMAESMSHRRRTLRQPRHDGARRGPHAATPEAVRAGATLRGSLISVRLPFGVPFISPYND